MRFAVLVDGTGIAWFIAGAMCTQGNSSGKHAIVINPIVFSGFYIHVTSSYGGTSKNQSQSYLRLHIADKIDTFLLTLEAIWPMVTIDHMHRVVYAGTRHSGIA